MGEQFRLPSGMQPGMPQQFSFELSQATQLACACGCKHFTPAATVYKISALVSPTGQELTAQVPVLLCMECKAVLALDKKDE